MASLEHALGIAAAAHEGQRKWNGEPFVLHVLRVVLRVDGDLERQVAALHDVLEKSDWTADRLRGEGFDERVVRAVVALTKADGEPYDDAVARAAADPLGRVVKRADLLDNLSAARRAGDAAGMQDRARRYRRGLRVLDSEP